jgi:hypothetical protein
MKKFTLARCSDILKDPYKTSGGPIYKFRNSIVTYINLRNMENFFLDFDETKFSSQAKQIFEETGYCLRDGNLSPISRMLNYNIYQALRSTDPEKHTKDKNDYIVQYFNQKTFDWKIKQARILYLSEFMQELNEDQAQITMKFSTEQEKDNYIVFERKLTDNLSFYSWKIFLINYAYFGGSNKLI